MPDYRKPRRHPGESRDPDAGRRSRAAPAPAADAKGDRIAKLLARAGVASRRDIEKMIAEGRVALNGQPLTTPATVLANLEGVTVDGDPVQAAESARLFLFHKPAGFLTTARDPGGRPTIYDALPPGLPRLVPVGRLDLSTEGLLLLTNDGALKRSLELPATGVPRSYRVRAYGEVRQADLEALADGVTLEGVRYGSVIADVERRTGRNVWLTMTLTEGKNREVRKLCEAMGLQVSRLIRVGYGPFQLGDIPARGLAEADAKHVAELRRQLKLPAERADARARHPGESRDPGAARRTSATLTSALKSDRGDKPARPARAARPSRPAARSRADGALFSTRVEGERSAARAERAPRPPRSATRPSREERAERSADGPPRPARAGARPPRPPRPPRADDPSRPESRPASRPPRPGGRPPRPGRTPSR